MLGWPGGPGFWLVLRHADVETVLTQPQVFSSALGGTQIRDPTTPEALRYVRRMMLSMDPPEHSRLRRLLTKSFTPRPVAQLEERIRGHARAIVARVVADAESGQCDFAKDVAADLPLSTLAEVLGMPAADLVEPGHRLPGPRLRLVRRVRPGIRHDDGPRGPPAASFARPRRLDARSAHAGGNARPLRLRAPPRRRKTPAPRERRHVDPARSGRRRRRPGVRRGVREHVLALRRRRQRDTSQRSAGGVHRPARLSVDAGRPTGRPLAAAGGGRGAASMVDPRHDVSTDGGVGLPPRRGRASHRAKGRCLLYLRQPRRDGVFRSRPARHSSASEPAPRTRARPALLPGCPARPCADAGVVRRGSDADGQLEYNGRPAYLRSNFQRGVKRLPIRWSRAARPV